VKRVVGVGYGILRWGSLSLLIEMGWVEGREQKVGNCKLLDCGKGKTKNYLLVWGNEIVRRGEVGIRRNWNKRN
jgi:hypothetical protein